jgi:hypothetical protein
MPMGVSHARGGRASANLHFCSRTTPPLPPALPPGPPGPAAPLHTGRDARSAATACAAACTCAASSACVRLCDSPCSAHSCYHCPLYYSTITRTDDRCWMHGCRTCKQASHVSFAVAVQVPGRLQTLEHWWNTGLATAGGTDKSGRAAILIYRVWYTWKERNRRILCKVFYTATSVAAH